MHIQRISAFCQDNTGGNPAGVVLLDSEIAKCDMAKIAADVGYSETAFAVRVTTTKNCWRVRYFSPESEVPFCGHATLALGAALTQDSGPGTFQLILNDAQITIETTITSQGIVATLSSPPTHSHGLGQRELLDGLALFNFTADDLDPQLPPAHMHAGADHMVLALRSRERLANMDYQLDAGKTMMRKYGLVTIMLVFVDNNQRFTVRNAFASGGVFEDPATGAAAAAFAGYLRDQGWPHGGQISLHQGEDMGQPSTIWVKLTDKIGSAVMVSGNTRPILS